MTREHVDSLTRAILDRFGGAEVEAEPVNDRGRFRIAVVSPEFRQLTHLQRQDALWAVVDATLPAEAALDISLILAYAPEDLAAAG